MGQCLKSCIHSKISKAPFLLITVLGAALLTHYFKLWRRRHIEELCWKGSHSACSLILSPTGLTSRPWSLFYVSALPGKPLQSPLRWDTLLLTGTSGSGWPSMMLTRTLPLPLLSICDILEVVLDASCALPHIIFTLSY